MMELDEVGLCDIFIYPHFTSINERTQLCETVVQVSEDGGLVRGQRRCNTPSFDQNNELQLLLKRKCPADPRLYCRF